MARRPTFFTHERIVLCYYLLGGLPAAVLSAVWLWRSEQPMDVRLTVGLVVFGCWLGFAFAVQNRVVRPLQTMSNLLLALKEGDFALRARGASEDDALGNVLLEINSLGDILQANRRGAQDADALLSTVIREIDVAIFAFDADGVVRLVNPAAEAFVGRNADRILGKGAREIRLAGCLEGEPDRILGPSEVPLASGRWRLRRTTFRRDGRPHQLVVFGDLSRPLREEQLRAWQHLVRVLGHELNNSLAPIKSIASTLGGTMSRPVRAADWEEDMRGGLSVIASRAESLERFMQGYARIARLPAPRSTPFVLKPLLDRVAGLERAVPVEVLPGPAVSLLADADQVEQALINLLKNAAEAAAEQAAPKVRLSWRAEGAFVEILIEDNGPGLSDTANLFVPFFTTKQAGSGIGLVLCQQIAEQHGGSLSLRNRTDAAGCLAKLRLPRAL